MRTRIFWYDALRRLFGLTLTAIYRRSIELERTVPAPYRASLATLDDLAPFCGQPDYDLDFDFARTAFARGDLCTAIWDGSRLAAYGWRAYGPAPHINGIWVRFGPGQRYSYKAFTHPDYRGRRLRGSFGLLAERDDQEGVTHLIAFIDINNTPSIKSTVHNGSTHVGYAGYVQGFGRLWYFRSPGAARHGFRFFSQSSEAVR